jgi:hypothetical protein
VAVDAKCNVAIDKRQYFDWRLIEQRHTIASVQHRTIASVQHALLLLCNIAQMLLCWLFFFQ